MSKTISFKLLAVAGLSVGMIAAVSAEPGYARFYKAEAGYLPSCNACHSDGGGSPLNLYGKAWDEAGHSPSAFAAIADLDSDEDGASNSDEFTAKSNPGDRHSRPNDAGGWLSPLALIPKAIRQHFEGVTAYKPMDTLFTESDFTRAKSMGVELSEVDETVIYLPLEGRNPVGMSVIVPVAFAEQRAHILVATNGRLVVNHVEVVTVPDGVELTQLDRFNGMFAPRVVAPAEPQNWDDAVAMAVKKSGVIIYVRLKR